MSPVLKYYNGSVQNEENETIMKWWNEFYERHMNSTIDQPIVEDSFWLQNLKIVVLLLIGVFGAIIIGCLLFCMFYKNERVLQTIPGTKEYKSRKKQPESFYPIPHVGVISGNQSKSLPRIGSPKLLGGKAGRLRPAISGLYARKNSREADAKRKSSDSKQDDGHRLEIDEGNRSDGSSLHESDGVEEYEAPDNTFPAGGQVECRKTKEKRKKKNLKGVRRLRKKNKYSTTIVTTGAAPNAEEEPQGDQHSLHDDTVHPNDVTFMSRF